MSDPTSPPTGRLRSLPPAELADSAPHPPTPQPATPQPPAPPLTTPQANPGQQHYERADGPFPQSLPAGPDGPYPTRGFFCPSCGAKNHPQAVMCQACQGPMPLFVGQAPAFESNNDGLAMVLPVGVNGFAIAAGYLGLLSLIGIFAPFALATGIIALVQLKKHPKQRGKVRAWVGVIMGGLMTLLLLVGLAAWVLRK